MKLESTVSVYGHEFSLNVAVKQGLDWTGTAPKWVHYCMIQLGDNEEQALAKAQTIKVAMGSEYKCSLRASPKVPSYSEDL